MHDVIIMISTIIIIATIFAYIARLLNQPIIPAYILAGLLIGPLGLKRTVDLSFLFSVSEIAIAFLLFIVGLEISYKRFKSVGKNVFSVGIIHIIILVIIGYFASLMFGFFGMEALYIGLAIAFSSTMIVLKLLSDSEDLTSLHGRILIGMLLIEDIVIIIVMMVLKNADSLSIELVLFSVLKLISFLIFAILFARYVLPKLFESVAKHQDFLFLGSLAWLFFAVLISNYIDFSIAIGAFIAGISLASTPYNIEIIGKIKHLKDFFIAIFFVSLGMLIIPIPTVFIIPIIVFVIIAVLFKAGLIYFLLQFNYSRKISFICGTYMAQVSEFSLILATTGLMTNHISQEVFSIIVIMTLITMSMTPYISRYNRSFFNKIASKYNISNERKDLENLPEQLENHVVLCGAHRTGCEIIKSLEKVNQKFVVIDYNPEVIKELMNNKIKCIYGDVEDLEVLNKVKIDTAKIVISTVPYLDENLFVLKVLKLVNKKCAFLTVAKDTEDAFDLYSHGADCVIVPHTAGGEVLSYVFREYLKNNEKIKKLRKKHIDNLRGKEGLLEGKDPFFDYLNNEH